MRNVLRNAVAMLGASSASLTLAAPAPPPAAPQAVSSTVSVQVDSELHRRWPELRAKIASSGVADIGEQPDWLLTTIDELDDLAVLQPAAAARLGLPPIRLGPLSSGDAQAALAPILTLLQRQKALLALSDRPPGRVDACKVDPRNPETCLPASSLHDIGPMLATLVRNNSSVPQFIALLETSSSLGIGIARVRGQETVVRLEPGKSLLIEPVAGTGLKAANYEILVVSDRAFDPAPLVQPSPYGSTATCYMRLYADCIARVPPLPPTVGLSGIRFTYDEREQAIPPAMGGGQNAGRGDADWMVELYSTLVYTDEEIEADKKLPPNKRQYLEKRTLEERAHACGGTMLAPNLVLTAAHCVATGRFFKPNERQLFTDRRVRIGSLRLGRGGETRAIVGAVIHDGYTGLSSGIPFDIALLLVKSDEQIRLAPRPLKVATAAPPPGATLTGLGWGFTQSVMPGANLVRTMTNTVQRNPQILQSAPLEVLAAPLCSPRVEGKLRPGMLCLVTPKAVADSGRAPTFSCRGDSGGPLVRNYGGAQEELVGLTSWSLGCGYKDIPSVYTDAAYFSRWVEAARKAIRPDMIIRVRDTRSGR